MRGVCSKKDRSFGIEQHQKWEKFLRLFVKKVVGNILIKLITLKQELYFGYGLILKLLHLSLNKPKRSLILLLVI
jgi:hypothetical protein